MIKSILFFYLIFISLVSISQEKDHEIFSLQKEICYLKITENKEIGYETTIRFPDQPLSENEFIKIADFLLIHEGFYNLILRENGAVIKFYHLSSVSPELIDYIIKTYRDNYIIIDKKEDKTIRLN
ncbi:MAG: hypothetical protein HYR91_01825 [Flavobacteriia bacterium]|nr:hypothetical protein [Flavobacteriia bacterium]